MKMNTKRQYDSIIPWLYIHEKQHLLDDNFRKSISSTTVSYWRSKGYENYYGQEYRYIMAESMDLYELIHERHQLKKTLFAIAKVWISISKKALPILHKDKGNSAWLLDQTQNLFKTFSKKTAFKIMGFNRQTFHYRITSLLACTGSSINKCLKQNSRQLSLNEVIAIRALFENKDKAWWSMSSLYYHGLRTGILQIGLSTFYKYAKLLGLSRKPSKPTKHKKGISTTAPNQFLHVDTTYWSLNTGHKSAIVFASDNFSRFITGYTVAERNSAINVYNTIEQTIKAIHTYHPNHILLTNIVVDGGAENNNKTVDELIRENEIPPITKLIAREDIAFSNSPIEAINKIFKRYLRYYKPQTYSELQILTDQFVEHYNTIRPHGSLKGLTPFEAYQNHKQISYSEQITNARALRISANKAMICNKCR